MGFEDIYIYIYPFGSVGKYGIQCIMSSILYPPKWRFDKELDDKPLIFEVPNFQTKPRGNELKPGLHRAFHLKIAGSFGYASPNDVMRGYGMLWVKYV